MDAVILGNGEYPTHSMPETMLIMASGVNPLRMCSSADPSHHTT